MIVNNINFFSNSLGLRTSMTVLLPQQSSADTPQTAVPPYKTLYLLHGHSDDHTAWMRWTSIERYVEGLNMAVVMPNGYLSFYTDMTHGGKYWEYISKEVPMVTREMFHLSEKREDTFAAGLSMGGYGAFKLALACPERFAAGASLSGAVNISEIVKDDGNPERKAFLEEMRNVYGNLKKVEGSKNDLFTLAEKTAKSAIKPRLYQCCGTEDFLYQNNLSFRDFARELPLDLTYEEGPGAHTWDYWDKMIQRVLTWFLE